MAVVVAAAAAMAHAHDRFDRLDRLDHPCLLQAPASACQRSLWASAWRRAAHSFRALSTAASARAASAASICSAMRLAACSAVASVCAARRSLWAQSVRSSAFLKQRVQLRARHGQATHEHTSVHHAHPPQPQPPCTTPPRPWPQLWKCPRRSLSKLSTWPRPAPPCRSSCQSSLLVDPCTRCGIGADEVCDEGRCPEQHVGVRRTRPPL